MRTADEIKKLDDKQLMEEAKNLIDEVDAMPTETPEEMFDARKKGHERDMFLLEIDDRGLNETFKDLYK